MKKEETITKHKRIMTPKKKKKTVKPVLKKRTGLHGSVKKKNAIVFKPDSYGGEYADYKLGTIGRDKTRKNYSVSYGYNQSAGVKNLTEAKKFLDNYTAKKTKHLSMIDVKVGDKIKFDNGKERYTFTIIGINHTTQEIDVKWRNKEAWIFGDDFENGFVKKLNK